MTHALSAPAFKRKAQRCRDLFAHTAGMILSVSDMITNSNIAAPAFCVLAGITPAIQKKWDDAVDMESCKNLQILGGGDLENYRERVNLQMQNQLMEKHREGMAFRDAMMAVATEHGSAAAQSALEDRLETIKNLRAPTGLNGPPR